MKIKILIVGMVFLLVPWLLVSCGISQELYDASVAERDSLIADLQSVQNEFGATKSKLDSVQSELESMKSEFQSVKDELDTKKSELESVKSELEAVVNQLSVAQSTIEDHEQKMAEAKTYTEIVSALFVPVLKGEESEINPIDFLFDWKESVEATGDLELEELFEAMIDSEFGSQELTDFFLYVFETLPKILE